MAMKRCCVEGCNAPAAALRACTTHLGLNGGPRVVPVPTEDKCEKTTAGMFEPEAEFAAMVAEHPGQEFEVPDGVLLFRRPTTPKRHRNRVVQRINHSPFWSRLPGHYRAWSKGLRVFVSWQPEKEAEEEVVVSGEVSKRYA